VLYLFYFTSIFCVEQKQITKGTRVLIDGLQGAAQYNGKIGVVKDVLKSNGRQNIFVEEDKKEMLLKPINFKPEPREIDSLSLKEMQAVLTSCGVKSSQLNGADKAELISMIEDKVTDKSDISLLIAKAKAPTPTSSTAAAAAGSGGVISEEQLRKGAETMANADPATLRAQAQALRSMDPNMVRRSNPAMANFTDQQIKDAATQMEQMADNPAMMKMAAEQMKNMTPQQIEEMKRMMGGGGGGGGSFPSSPASTGGSAMTGGAPSSAPTPMGGMPTDPSQMMNMDPKQLKSMMNMLKSNPEMLKSMKSMMPGGASISDEALMQQINSFADMDENQIKSFMSYAQTAQTAMNTAKSAWDKVNNLCFGQLLRILYFLGALLVFMLLKWLFFSSSSSSSSSSVPPILSNDGFQSFDSSDTFGSGDDDDLGYVPPTTASAKVSASVGAGGDIDDEFA
jgi:hypothetical protein